MPMGFCEGHNEHDKLLRYKAIIVAKGFRQKFGIAFFETYSPVDNMNSIRVVLSVVVAMGYMTEQLNAYRKRRTWKCLTVSPMLKA